ncbi:MAG: transporter substrate-binding domain-containing protein [Lachnospiraceae bacterium]|nr:transporter substrate-binding domain-containing protein [Lachnospiraceae bacterium]
MKKSTEGKKIEKKTIQKFIQVTAAAAVLSITAAGLVMAEDAAGSAEKTVVHAVTQGSPAPYVTVNEDGSFSGYDIEVLQNVFDRLPQYELDLGLAEFDAMLTGLNSGNYDIAVNNFSYREERAESYYFSYPYDTTTYVFIQRKEDEPLISLQDAADRGYKIEASAGGNVTNALEQWNSENPDSQIEITYSDSDLSVWFEHIEDGTSDFRIDDLPIYTAYQKEFGFDGLDSHVISDEETARISTALNAYFLFPKDAQGAALREDIDGALLELKEDGTLLELTQKYFGADQVPDDADFETTMN